MLDLIRALLAEHHESLRVHIDRQFTALQQEIHRMSGTLETDLSAQTAAVQALATEVTDGLAANAAAIQALKDQIANGGTVSAADLTTLEGNTKAIQDATTALQAALNPAPPTP